MKAPDAVRLTEVCLRDGLQSLDRVIPTAVKLQVVEAIIDAGFRSIEVTSFSRPDIVPQTADAELLVRELPRRDDVEYRALTPNLYGAKRAIAVGIDTMVALVTASDSYTRRNQGSSVEEAVLEVGRILECGRANLVRVEVAVGMAFFDPYEGDTPPETVERLVAKLVDLGAERIYLATSSGMAGPGHVHQLCSLLLDRWPWLDIGMHLHNTNGLALANALAAMDAGVTRFEGALCGIGGGIAMPAGMPPVGNVATEDLVHLLTLMDIDTDLKLEAVIDCANQVAQLLGVEPASYAARGGHKSYILELAKQ